MHQTLLVRTSSLESLTAAWDYLRSRTESTYGQPRGIKKFAAHAESNIRRLRTNLMTADFHPRPMRGHPYQQANGKIRWLSIPDVRDRVLERSILETVNPYVDPFLGPAAYGYRPGLGVRDAVAAVAGFRDDGYKYVLRADVANCFPNIDVDGALDQLLRHLPDRSLDDVLWKLALRETVVERRRTFLGGLPQGSSLSPLLSNLFLWPLDDALLLAGFPTVRYADDFTVACTSRHEGNRAARIARDALWEIGLTMNDAKTEVMSFDEGFCFLGDEFGPKYPAGTVESTIPLRRTLYLARQGARCRVAEGRVIVESSDDEKLLSVASSHISRIVCFGSVGVTAGARAWAMSSDVDIIFLSRNGKYHGQLLSAGAPSRTRRLRAQLRASEHIGHRVSFARAELSRKIAHQATLLMKLNRTSKADTIRQSIEVIQRLAQRAAKAVDVPQALGFEGLAASEYFSGLAVLLPESAGFRRRGERPATDVVNAALNYGYALLLAECVAALVAAGLEPGIGLIHEDLDNRPSLALDLMEEFRPLVVDQVVLTLVHRNIVKATNKANDDSLGFRLDDQARQALIDAFERRMLQTTSGAIPDFSGSVRRHLYRQAQRLAQFIDNPEHEWSGLAWR